VELTDRYKLSALTPRKQPNPHENYIVNYSHGQTNVVFEAYFAASKLRSTLARSAVQRELLQKTLFAPQQRRRKRGKSVATFARLAVCNKAAKNPSFNERTV
jgi:hypothetical protein